jgi:amino acid adenylation domain-containing protein
VADRPRDDAFREEIVIIGMAGRFPGAPSVDEFWANLRAGKESIRPLTPDELKAAGVDGATAGSAGYVAAGAPLEHADAFDAAFFGYSRREAELMDPQHRVFLECAWSALEDAGYDPATYPGVIGLFGGVAPNTYRHHVLQTRPDILGMTGRYPLLIGSEREYAMTRTAFKLDLEGPAISVNTACSTSGVALHLACQSVLSGECDMALAGGVRISVPLTAGYLYEEDGILSPDGHCRAFDVDAKGTVVGSGVAIVVVKRLSDAQCDGDTIHAIVKGTAVNNDGADKIGFTAPSVRGQEAVIRQALDMAEVDASTIGYVEAHGTGTFIGDPIEVEALTRAFRQDTDATGYCRIGSVKTNIGHLDAGAGVAGVIKAVLSLERGEIPPSLNLQTPNPQIDFAASPFRVSDRLSTWPAELSPRRSAVSSFGLGGTNAHVVLEEAPPTAAPSPSQRDHHLIVLSARSDESMERATQNLAAHLERHRELELPDVAYTLAVGRRHHSRRRAVVARDASEAARALTAPAPRPVREVAGDRPVVFMFPGGGAQHVGMARRLYATEPEFRRWFDRCADLMPSRSAADLRSLVYGEHNTDLERPTDALPTLFATEYATARLLESLGVRPDLMIGHSLGEYTAACLANVMSLEDAVALVALRGELFETLPPGGMLAVQLSVSALEQHLDADLSIAVINKPELCIVAGAERAVEALERRLAQLGVEARRLHIGVAAHSHLVEPILDRFGDFASTIDFSEPSIPYVSNLTGKVIDSDEICKPDYWVAHLRNTVRFDEGLAAALAGEPKVMVEVGPGQILSGFARQHEGRMDGQVVVATLPHPSETTPDDAFFLEAVGKLWAAGVPVDLAALHSGEERRRVPLPTYPFDRTRYWIEPGDTVPSSGSDTDLAAPAPPRGGSGAAGSTEKVPASRRDRIRTRVLGVFSELSGLAEPEIDPHATFLELGFDSLFMTQATAAVGSAFGTRVSFRQLFEDAPTIDALAGWLDTRLPEDAFPAIAAAPSDDGQSRAEPTGLDQIAAQLAELQLQLAALQRGEPRLAAPAAEGPASVEPSVPPAEATGPWRPPERRADDLDADQIRHLAELTSRLTSRSPGSKAATQTSRSHLADPRTVAGFRRAWKEIVYPVVAERSAGSKVWDVDGNEYLDIAMGFGVNLFGHSPPFVIDAVTAQLARGIEIGPQTPLAGEVAGLIAEMTGHERVAFCNTGSEAVLAAMRLARTVTGRSKIVTFANDYHGIFDEVLARGVSQGGTRRSIPIAQGIPQHAPQDLVIFDYTDPEALRYIAEHASELAAVLVEPVQSRHPDLQPVDFLRELRRATAESKVALIFDEMITGFRSHPGGVQALFGVKADLATYGKVVGGGFPIGVVAGDARFMDALDGGTWRYGDDSIPEADVTWFAGTFVRHPVALAAARAALLHLRETGPELQAGLNARTTEFVDGLNGFLRDFEVSLRVEHFSSLFLVRFERDQQFSSLFYFHLRDHGIHVTEGRAAFLSTAHSDADLERLDAACRAAVTAMAESRFLSRGGASARRGEQPRVLPVTDGQQEILLSAFLSADANCAYNLSNTLHITGPVDVDILRRSIDELAVRHDALRVTFTADGTAQRVAADLKVPFTVVDLSGLDDDARLAALAEQRATEVDTPFDLVDGPLVRARLIRMAEHDHHLFLTIHHAVCDGWSSGTLLHHVTEIYTAQRQGRAAELPASMQLSEYADWFAQYRASEEYAADERFWVDHVGAEFPVTDLPGDHPRPPRKSYRAERLDRPLAPQLVADLRAVAKAEGCTLFTLLLGSFECLLARLTGQREIGLAVSIGGQTRFPGRDLVAHCVNALPLRRMVDGDSSFSHHLQQTQAAFLDAFDHQDFSYGAIVRSSGVRRDPSRTPLVSVIFNMDSPAQPFEMDGALAIPGSNERHSETFDVFVNVVPRVDELVIECTYNVDLFDTGTIERRVDEWLTVLSGVAVSGGDVLVGDLEVVPRAELALLEAWNSTTVDFGADHTLVSRFEAAVASHGDAVALEFAGRVVSYSELGAMARRVARHLVGIGVVRGSMVGVLCERSVEMVAGIYGVVMAGAAYVPLDTEYPFERIAHMVRETEMQVVLTQAPFRGLIADPGVALVNVEELLVDLGAANADAAGVALPHVEPDDVAYVIYTSGSTGRPKGVANTHRGVVNRCATVQDRFGLRSGDVALLKAPISFDVSVSELFWPLRTGARLVVAEPGGHRDPAYLVETIKRCNVDTVDFVPSMLRLFLDHPAASSCTSLRRVLCGGEAMTRDLQDRFFAVLPDAELHNLYGPTEAAVDVTAWRCRLDDAPAVVPIGAPHANTSIHLLDDRMRRVPIGIPGELYIGGVQIAACYVNHDDLTAERFIPDPFDPGGRLYRTGDLARWLPSGQVEFLGRVDDQVKLRGQRIEPGEIEATLGEHPDVLEAAVVVRADATGDPSLVAYLVAHTGSRIDVSEVREHLKARLPVHMIPAGYTVLDEPPLTTNGKLDRKALPAPGPIDARTAGDYVAPRTDLERDIARMWSDVLGVDDVGSETDFFDLGGHSLKLMQLASRIELALGVRPPLAALFESPTVTEQAVLVTEALIAADVSSDEILAEVLANFTGPDEDRIS